MYNCTYRLGACLCPRVVYLSTRHYWSHSDVRLADIFVLRTAACPNIPMVTSRRRHMLLNSFHSFNINHIIPTKNWYQCFQNKLIHLGDSPCSTQPLVRYFCSQLHFVDLYIDYTPYIILSKIYKVFVGPVRYFCCQLTT